MEQMLSIPRSPWQLSQSEICILSVQDVHGQSPAKVTPPGLLKALKALHPLFQEK